MYVNLCSDSVEWIPVVFQFIFNVYVCTGGRGKCLQNLHVYLCVCVCVKCIVHVHVSYIVHETKNLDI